MKSRLTISRLAQVFGFGEAKTPGRCLVECMVRGDARCRVEIEVPLSDREGRPITNQRVLEGRGLGARIEVGGRRGSLVRVAAGASSGACARGGG